jgi:hypothetical protein
MVYGRRMYEVMRYWDEDSPDLDADERDYPAAVAEPSPNEACAAAKVRESVDQSRPKHPLVFEAAGGLRFQPTGVGM